MMFAVVGGWAGVEAAASAEWLLFSDEDAGEVSVCCPAASATTVGGDGGDDGRGDEHSCFRFLLL